MRKKGISLISLSIAVVILMALASTITISLTFSINNAKKMAFAKEIYNIQSIVDEYIQNEDTIPKTLEVIEISPTDVTQFNSETLTNDKLLLETLDLQSLGLNSTSYGNKEIGETDAEKSKDVYAISQATGKIYYIAGVNIGGKKYYTLTDELRQMIEKNQELNIAEETITFIPSKVGWSKDAITVKVTVPSGYTSPSVSINNTNIQYSTTTENGVTYYNINTSSVAESYTVTVNYTKGGVTSTASYTAKLDKTAPVISKDTNVLNTAEKINGLKAVDSESGIKYFKYAEGVISSSNVKEYMHSYGKDITNGSINFKKKQNYTLYAEDKAGNCAEIYLDVTGKLTTTVMPIGATLIGYNDYLTSKTIETSGDENTAPTGSGSEGTPTKQNVTSVENLTWKYIGLSDDGKIKLAADMPETTIEESQKVQLSGKGGWTNGANELNDICHKLYSVQGISTGRSVNLNDIQSLLGYNGPKGRYISQNGDEKFTENALSVLEMVNKNKEPPIEYNISTPNGISITECKSDYYEIKSDSSYITKPANKSLVFYQTRYWIANPCSTVDFKYRYVGFHFYAVAPSHVGAITLYQSTDTTLDEVIRAIRPVIELNSNVVLSYDSTNNTCRIVTN